MRHPQQLTVNTGGIALSVNHWQGEGDPVLLLHATGFHSRCWNQVVARLPGQTVYAADLRFHGASGAAGEVNWPLLVEDVAQLIEQLDLNQLVGVGHSIGGHIMARVAARRPHRFKQLVLIDPVIMSPQHYDELCNTTSAFDPANHPVSRRKNRWRDADEMYQRFRDKPPFNRWQAEVLRDYCDYALQPADEDGVAQLCCDPLNEAAIYLNQKGNGAVHAELGQLNVPTTLLRAAPSADGAVDLSTSPTWPELAGALPCCREIYLPHMSHFIPMEDPGLVANYIASALHDQWQHEALALS